MKVNLLDVGGTVVKDNETYLLKDNKALQQLVLSSTQLRKGQSTRGHSHPGQEEVYFFVSGEGEMELGEERFPVKANDVVLIPDGVFHRVHNMTALSDLYFVCVFNGGRNH